ncbi:MAG TPA: protein kinase [Streptomyces sp.]|nr:protein kinase [Streptomyces sp.]
MDDYAGQAGRLLADRYRLPQPLAESYYVTESVAYDTASGQEVLVRQIPLPEVVEAEVVGDGVPGEADGVQGGRFRGSVGRATRRPADPAVHRAVEAAVAAARIPDHPRLDQVFDVFVEGEGLWIVSELLPATPLATLLENQNLTAHRAAEIAADLLTALRTVHAHGWTHRNVTVRTVLVCDDGRALLTGLAVGAAEEALCGYSPLPDSDRTPLPPSGGIPGPAEAAGSGEALAGGEAVRTRAMWTGTAGTPLPEGFDPRNEDELYGGEDPGPAQDFLRARDGGDGPRGIFGLQGLTPGNGAAEPQGPPVRHGYETGSRGARSGAIAAYQAGARRAAAARTEAAQQEQRGEQGQRREPASEYGQGSAGERTQEDWWGRPHPAPDDYVRWLPSGEDEVSPSDLPGSRPPNSRPVNASWRYGEPESVPHGELPGDGFAGDLVPYDAELEPELEPGPEPLPDEYPYGQEPENRPWGGEAAGEPGVDEHFRGPATALEAERARQARMTVVGAVSERWAPEQAGPVYENWRLAPPVGPAADLWALGVLLFRAVQGHAPYPEDDVAELVQMVCAEPPAFAEDCGPLRPVVESLMRQDPTERPDFEELRGWLRSLVRSAPEPDVGWHTVFAPSLESGGPSDPRRLPILRRRGELVRRRKAERRAAAAERQRHKRNRPKRESPQRNGAAQDARVSPPVREKQERPEKPRRVREKKSTQGGSSPFKLGRLLLGLVLLALTGAVLYAMWFMPKGDTDGASNQQRGSVGEESGPPQSGGGEDEGDGGQDDGKGGKEEGKGGQGGEEKPANPGSAAKVPKGYKLSRDPAGFQVAVPSEWDRRSTTGRGQVRYNGGEVEMVVVNGRDSTKKFGNDPMAYQSDDEPELAAYRASDWASTSGLRRIDVGETAMAEGTFSWRDGGRDVYARNRAMILDGRYHLLMVMGSKGNKEQIDRHFEAVADTYRATGSQ